MTLAVFMVMIAGGGIILNECLCKECLYRIVSTARVAAADAGNGKAVIGCSNSGSGMTAYVIDTAADKLVTSFRLKDKYEEFLGVSKQNELITQRAYGQFDDFEGTELVYYDLSTGKAQTVKYKTANYAQARYEKSTDTVCGFTREQLYTFGRDGSLRTTATSANSDGGYLY